MSGRRRLPALVRWLHTYVSLLAFAAPARAELSLLMFERDGCPYCRQWDREIAPIYGKTPEGQSAPLTRLDIHEPLPDGVTVDRAPQFTPTFVLLEDGVEVGRIEGYPGDAFFWALLDGLIAETERD